MSLGKTGPDENERFLNSIKSYRLPLTRWVNSKVTYETLEQKPELGDMPRHSFKAESLRISFMRALPDFLVMSLMILVLFAAAFVSFLRYDVR